MKNHHILRTKFAAGPFLFMTPKLAASTHSQQHMGIHVR